MTIDDTFDNVNRIWQEVSLIVVLHAVAIALAAYAHVLPIRTVWSGVETFASMPELSALRANLQRLGLDLPFVVGTAVVVYVVIFQRLSAAAVNIPLFRLTFSESALWRAGKCFDELRLLIHFFEGYRDSDELADVEVTLGLAVTQNAKEYEEHHRRLVDSHMVAARLSERYYSGLCLLAFVAIALFLLMHSGQRSLVLPGGLLLFAVVARCGWEARIERAVVGRLRFAIDCAMIVRGANHVEAPAREVEEPWYEIERWNPVEARTRRELYREIALAVELVKLPPPGLPYVHFWVLHFVRHISPFKKLGALPMVRNEIFRDWLLCEYSNAVNQSAKGSNENVIKTSLLSRIEQPEQSPDDRVVARLLRSRAWGLIGRWLFPGTFLIDEPARYWPREVQFDPLLAYRPRLERMPFRRWRTRRREQR